MKSKLSKILIFSSMLLFCFFTQSCTEENIDNNKIQTEEQGKRSKTGGTGGDIDGG